MPENELLEQKTTTSLESDPSEPEEDSIKLNSYSNLIVECLEMRFVEKGGITRRIVVKVAKSQHNPKI